jgi:hypothetical protein
MSEWKRGAKWSEIKRETNNTTNNKDLNKNTEFTRNKSFEYNNRNQRNQSNQRNNNYYNNNPIERTVSFDTHSRNRQEQQHIQNKPVTNIVQNNDNTAKPEPEPEPEPENTTSKWKEIIEAKKDDELELINEKDPKYWDGPYWIGPFFIKNIQKNTYYLDYIERTLINKHHIPGSGTFVLPYGDFKYSRNNKDWYSTREETYTPNEMEQITDFELQQEYNEYIQFCERDYQRSKIASDKYYDETGDLDAFAMEQNRLIEYEKYCEDFDKQLTDNNNNDETEYD